MTRIAHRPSYAVAAVLALVASALVLTPIFRVSWWENHDMIAYPVRLIELAHAIFNGELYPRWGPDLYGGYGAPLFNFYPPGAVAPAAPLFLLGVTPQHALKFSIFLYTAIGLFGAYLAGELLSGRRDVGFIALMTFALAPYRFTQLLLRGDLAEYCATALAMLALYCYLDLHHRGPTVTRCLGAAAAHAGIMLTHTITGQWSTELLGLLVAYFMFAAWRAGERRNVVAYALAFAGALGLMTVYVLPAMGERSLVRIADMATGKFATENNFLGELKWVTTPGFFFGGYPLIVGVPCAFVAWAVSATHRRQVLLWGLSSVVLVALMCSLSAPVWKVLPFGRFIMFPWRLLSFECITVALLSATLWHVAVSQRGLRSDIALLAIACLLAGRTYEEQVMPVEIKADKVPRGYVDVGRAVYSTVVFNEYLPLTVPKAPRGPVRALVAATSAELDVDSARHEANKLSVVVDAHAPGWIDLAHYDYPGWHLRTLSGPNATLSHNDEGLMRIELPAAGRYDLQIQFGTTPLRATAAALTWLTVLLLPIGLIFCLRKRREADAA